MKDRIALCWKCKIFYAIVFVAFLAGIFFLLYRVSTPVMPDVIAACQQGQQAGSHTVEYGATYDLFNKHFTLLFTVFGTLISLFGVVVPAAFYFFQQKQFKDKIQRIKDKFTFHQERLKQDLSDSNKNEISLLKSEIEKQQKELKEEIEDERKALRSEIEKSNQEAYLIASECYMDLSIITAKMFFANIEVLPNVIDLIAKTLQYVIKSKNEENIKTGIPKLVENIHGLIKVKPEICLSIDEEDIQIIQELIKEETVINDKETYDKCIEIISIYNAQKQAQKKKEEKEKK